MTEPVISVLGGTGAQGGGAINALLAAANSSSGWQVATRPAVP
jgi:hypothetical protein